MEMPVPPQGGTGLAIGGVDRRRPVAVIRDTSTMDRPVDSASRQRRRTLLLGAGAALLLGLLVLAMPSLVRWASSERAVDSARLRFGKVTRGDLVRDIA